jgi:hypothetical protein
MKNNNNKQRAIEVDDNNNNKKRAISTETVVESSNLVPRAERAECSACHEVMSSSTCVPALLVCGHASTCVSCYEKWNKGKRIKICPICKHTQTASPIKVGLYDSYKQEANLKIRVNYVGGFTRTGLDGNGTSNCDLIINMLTTGDEIKKMALPYFSSIQFPNDYLSLSFRTQDQSFPFHGNTTLSDIGFTQATHSLCIREEYLPFEHELVQKRLDLLEKSPDGKFNIYLVPARELKLTTCCLIVEKHYTMGAIADALFGCLEKVNLAECYVGKKFTVDLVKLGVGMKKEMTLEQLRINTKTIIHFNLID